MFGFEVWEEKGIEIHLPRTKAMATAAKLYDHEQCDQKE